MTDDLTMKPLAILTLLLQLAAGETKPKEWLVYQGKEGPGLGKHIVFLTGDEEYRSEEAGVALARILAERHGFKCTVLFAKNDPMMPLVWTREFTGESGKTSTIVTTTMGASVDLESEGLRRLLVNACYWTLGLQDKISPTSDVSPIGEFKPLGFGFGKHRKGVRPVDLEMKQQFPLGQEVETPNRSGTPPPSWSRQRPYDGSRGFQPTVGVIQLGSRRGATPEEMDTAELTAHDRPR